MRCLSSLRCPECGKEVRSERALRHIHIRWRLLVIAALSVIVAYEIPKWPSIRDRGFVAALPTFILVEALPLFLPLESEAEEVWMQAVLPFGKDDTNLMNQDGPASDEVPSILSVVRMAWFRELLHYRVPQEESMSGYSRSRLVRACCKDSKACEVFTSRWTFTYGTLLGEILRLHNDELSEKERRSIERLGTVRIRTRRQLPIGTEILGLIELESFLTEMRYEAEVRFDLPGSPVFRRIGNSSTNGVQTVKGLAVWTDSLETLGRVSQNSSSSLALEVVSTISHNPKSTSRVDWQDGSYRSTEKLHIQPVEEVETIITPVSNERFEHALASEFQPVVYLIGETVFLRVPWGRLQPLLLDLNGTTFAVRFALEHRGNSIAEGFAWCPARHASSHYELPILPGPLVKMRVTDHAETVRVLSQAGSQSDSALGSTLLRITGDPEVALRDFDATAFWVGEILLPVDIEQFPGF